MDRRTAAAAAWVAAASTALAAVVIAPGAGAERTLPRAVRIASWTSGGTPISNAGASSFETAVSGDGRFVAFVTPISLLPLDANGKGDVYLRDRWAATTELISVTDAERPIPGASGDVAISDDGRYVAFETAAKVVDGDDAGKTDVFVRDRFTGRTIWASPALDGGVADAESSDPDLAGGGRYLAFGSSATDLVAGDTNAETDVFVRDLQLGTTTRVSLTDGDAQAVGGSFTPSISDDGDVVAFTSEASLVPAAPAQRSTYVRDRAAGTTTAAAVATDGSVARSISNPSISGDGQVVAFTSSAANLVAGDTNGVNDAFVRDLATGTTRRVSVSHTGAQLAAASGHEPGGLDADGSHVLFTASDRATAAPDVGGDLDLFVHTEAGTRRVTSTPLQPDPGGFTFLSSISADGEHIAFFRGPGLTSEAATNQVYVDGPVGLGPFATPQDAIGRLHLDFLGRAPTSGEAAAWRGRVEAGSADVSTLIAHLASDPAYAERRAPLIRLYWAFFLRRPDSSGLTFWLGRYQRGTSLTRIAQSFAVSSEFTRRYGDVSNRQYVELVYRNIFEREPDAAGLAFWTGRLDRRLLSRGAVIVQFSESSEGKRRLAGPTNISLITMAMLGKVPDAATWDALYPTVDGGEAAAAWIGRQVLTSERYAQRVS
jgi:Tol biopolymer transport system component